LQKPRDDHPGAAEALAIVRRVWSPHDDAQRLQQRDEAVELAPRGFEDEARIMKTRDQRLGPRGEAGILLVTTG